MALSLIMVDNGYDHNYDVHAILKPGFSQDQVFKIMQSETWYDDLDYYVQEYVDFVRLAELEQSADFGVGYTFNLASDSCTVFQVNGGNGGVAEEDRDDSNVSFTIYSLSGYVSTSGIYGSPSFSPSSFLTDVAAPVFGFVSKNLVTLAFLSVTFVVLGIRQIKRAVGSFGRGR